VNRGLIEAADNEGELAGVTGHEIGHVVGRHGVLDATGAGGRGRPWGARGHSRCDGRAAAVGNVAAELVASGTFFKFFRDAKPEADRLGVVNVMAVGYAPRGMVTFLRRSMPSVKVTRRG